VMQLCFPKLKPPKPTIRTSHVAERIARRIVAEVNLDDFYWELEEVPECVEDVKQEIMRCGRPATVFDRLSRKGVIPIKYDWDGIDEHCRHIGDRIAKEELERAMTEYRRDYGKATT